MWTLIVIAYLNGQTIGPPSFASEDFNSKALCEAFKSAELTTIRDHIAGDAYMVCVPKGSIL